MRRATTLACTLTLCLALSAGALAQEPSETEITGGFTPVIDTGSADGAGSSDEGGATSGQDADGATPGKDEAAQGQQGGSQQSGGSDSSSASPADDVENELELSEDSDGQVGADAGTDDEDTDAERVGAGDDGTTEGAAPAASGTKDAKKDADKKKDTDKKPASSPEAGSFLFLLLGCIAVAVAVAAAYFIRSKRGDADEAEGEGQEPWADGAEADEDATLD